MDRDTVTALAREAGFVGMDGDHGALRRFAALVAAHEREECAKVCEGINDGTPYNLAAECAAAIRSRT